MPKLKPNQVPSYRLHKQSGQAIVTLNGRDILLGKYGSEASRAEYRRLAAEWLAKGRQTVPVPAKDQTTVYEVVAAFWQHAQATYTRPVLDSDGKPRVSDDGRPAREATGELDNFRCALRPLKTLYGPTLAKDFGPPALKAVMGEMVRMGWSRTYTNRQAARIKQVFKWAVAQEMVPPGLHHALTAVDGLRAGRCEARETEPVKPVPEEHVDAVKPHLPALVREMVELQLVTGMRPGELVTMRTCDIDTSATPWTYTPASHKTKHHGHQRVIYLGPKAQAIVEKRLKPDLQAPIFSPAESEAARHKLQREKRETNVQPSQLLRSKQARSRRRRRPPTDRYTVDSYRRSIARACEKAFGMPAEIRPAGDDTPEQKQQKRAAREAWRKQHVWHPHQLRHNAATRLRREFGLEAAQVILGHKTLTVTQVYAEKNVEAARRIMGQIG